MLWKAKQICHPVWQYLNQPVFERYQSQIWHPYRFWYSYKIKLLEKCLRKDINSESHYTQ